MSLFLAGSILLDITFKEGQNGPELKKEIFNKLDEVSSHVLELKTSSIQD